MVRLRFSLWVALPLLFFALLPLANLTAQRAPDVQERAKRPKTGYRQIAIAKLRIDRDRIEVRVFRGGQVVELQRFTELVVITPLRPAIQLRDLVDKTVLLVPSQKLEGQWDIFADAPQIARRSPPLRLGQDFAGQSRNAPIVGDALTLPDNVFMVRQVLLSTQGNPVEVAVGAEHCKLKPGEALLVLD